MRLFAIVTCLLTMVAALPSPRPELHSLASSYDVDNCRWSNHFVHLHRGYTLEEHKARIGPEVASAIIMQYPTTPKRTEEWGIEYVAKFDKEALAVVLADPLVSEVNCDCGSKHVDLDALHMRRMLSPEEQEEDRLLGLWASYSGCAYFKMQDTGCDEDTWKGEMIGYEF